MGECRLLLFLAIGQVLQNLWHFEILTLESVGKPKMWNISNIADSRAKRAKFGTRGTIVHIWRLLLMPNSLTLVWGHLVQNFQFYNCYNSAPLPIFIQFIQTLYEVP